MKIKEKTLAAVMTAVLMLGITACNPEDSPKEDSLFNYETPRAVLPEAKGENIFKGKTFNEVMYPMLNVSLEWTFGDSNVVVKKINTEESEVIETDSYRYSYDSEKSLLYLALESYESDDVYISSLNDVAARIKKYDGQDMAIEYFVKGSAALFATPRVYKYEIGASGQITTALYFEGKVPSCVEFGTADKDFGSIPDGCYISDGMIEFYEGNSYYVFFCSFDNGSYSGSGYSFQKNILLQPSECGSISGSYVAEGTGCSGCTVTITFTDKPADIKSFTTGTPYVLNQHILGSDRLNYQ